MRGMYVVLVAAALSLGAAPKQQPNSQQQAKGTVQPTATKQQEPSSGGKQTGCPGTDVPQLSCEAVTAWATVRQANLMHGSNILSFMTVLVAGLAAGFAWQAADAARKNLAHDKRRARDDLRPWLTHNGFEAHSFTNSRIAGEPAARGVAATIVFINSGKSPALRVGMYVNHEVTPMRDDAPEFSAAYNPNFLGAIGPNYPMYTSERAVGPAEADAIIAGTSCLWLYGKAEYEERGHEGKPYVTEVCLRISAEGHHLLPDGRRKPRFMATVAGPQNTMS
jgi:hypothetical protein